MKGVSKVRQNPTRILLADDDPQFCDILEEYLSQLGYSVVIAHDGQEALEKFGENRLRLVLSDLQMPRMDGLELLDRIKQIDPQATVIVLTGFGTIETAVDAIKKGAYDFVTKPVKLEHLQLIIARALEKDQLQKQLGRLRGMVLMLLVFIPFWLFVGAWLGLRLI